MLSLLYVVIWVLPSVVIGVMAGYYLGRAHAPKNVEEDLVQQERARTMKALLATLKSTEQLTTDVDSHQHELADVERQVGHMAVTGELEEVQHVLLRQIGSVMEANRRLEDDLVCARYRLEMQAQELDRTRLEARCDPLSGVSNRMAFDERLNYMLSAFKRDGLPFTLVLCDVDHFKWINDTHGHTAGDQVVGEIGALLRDCIRDGDFVGRFGGDEFALLLGGLPSHMARQVADRIRVICERHNFTVGAQGQRSSVTFSMGLASVQRGDTAESLLARADAALYASKHAGRNKVHSSEELPAGSYQPA